MARKQERTGNPKDDVRRLDSVRALAVLANPDRARLMDLLAASGTSTTSTLADAAELATGSVSHHLGVLTDAGLVERVPDEEAGDRRQRRWRLVTRGMRWNRNDFRDRPAGVAAATAADRALLERQYERAHAFLDKPDEPWDDAALACHTWLRLTADELAEFGRQVEDLMISWRRRTVPDDGEQRRTVMAYARAFPSRP